LKRMRFTILIWGIISIVFNIAFPGIVIAAIKGPEETVHLEAEDFFSLDSTGWEVNSAYRGYKGTGYLVSHGIFESRHAVRYRFRIEKPDTYFVFLRTWSSNPGNNGVFLELDGRPPDIPEKYKNVTYNKANLWLYFPKKNQWTWETRVGCGPNCRGATPFFIIKKPGVHELILRVREIDARVDALRISPANKIPEAASNNKEIEKNETQSEKKIVPIPESKKPLPRIGKAYYLGLIPLLLILLFWFRTNRLKGRSLSGPHAATVEKVELFIRENITGSLDQESLGEVAGIDPDYLAKIFKKSKGETPNQFIKTIRIERAVELIKTTDLNISQIHHQVGIPHASYFAKIFKEKMGLSPSDALKKYRGSQ